MQEINLSERQTETLFTFFSWKYDEILYWGWARWGKAQSLNAKILTPNGWKRMWDIMVGDSVITPENNIEKVLQIHPQWEKDIYEVETIDWAKTTATEDHLWYSWMAQHPKWAKVRTTRDIINILDDNNRKNKNVLIPLSNPLDFWVKYNWIHPYLIWFLLWDWWLTQNQIQFTTSYLNIVDYIKEITPNFSVNKLSNKYAYSITYKWKWKNPILEEMKRMWLMGRCEKKHISKELLESDLETRLNLLQGLMDSDW